MWEIVTNVVHIILSFNDIELNTVNTEGEGEMKQGSTALIFLSL